jgi:hypothetical protein
MVFAATFAGQLHAQDFEGKNITEVAIRYRGAKTVDEARIRNLMATKAGTQYRAERLDNDIKTLFESGLIDDVRFLAEPAGGGVRVIADVLTRPAINGVGFVGNTVFSDQKLAKETKLKAGGAMSDSDILEARRNLEKYYQGYGYPDVLISHRTQDTGQAGLSDLIFVIDEGSKNEVRKIRFEGNTVFTTPELKKEMKTKEKGWFSWLTKSGRFESYQLDEDLDAVLDYYRSNGYLRASSPGIRRDPVGDGRVDLVIPISEGEKYTVDGVSFGRMTVFKSEELYPSMTLNGGDAYSSSKMRDDIKTIRSFYGSRGYADAVVAPDIKDAGPNRVTVKYQITEGSRYRVGRVNIQGNTKTKDKVIRREVPLKPGDWFNTVELETTKARLENLQYFSDVQATGNPGGSGYRDVDILVEERNTGSIGVGVGFSSVDSIVGFLTLEQSNFDIMNPWNFTGGGQRFSMSLRAGSERSEFSVSLVEPWFLDQRLALERQAARARGGRRLWLVGERGPEDAGERLGNRLFGIAGRGDHDLEPLHRAGEAHVERRDRLADDWLRGRHAEFPPFIRQERLKLLRHGNEHPPNRRERSFAIDHHPWRVGDELAVEVGEHDEVEFESLGLMDRHHSDRRRHRIGHARAPALRDEGSRADEARSRAARRQIPGPRRFDKLLEPPHIPLRAVRGDDGREPPKHRAVAVVDQFPPQGVDRRYEQWRWGRRRPTVRTEPEIRRQRRRGHVKPRSRIGGMVDEREHRQQEFDSR